MLFADPPPPAELLAELPATPPAMPKPFVLALTEEDALDEVVSPPEADAEPPLAEPMPLALPFSLALALTEDVLFLPIDPPMAPTEVWPLVCPPPPALALWPWAKAEVDRAMTLTNANAVRFMVYP